MGIGPIGVFEDRDKVVYKSKSKHAYSVITKSGGLVSRSTEGKRLEGTSKEAALINPVLKRPNTGS